MDELPPLATGFVRLELRFRLPNGVPPSTPGELVRASGLHPDQVGPIMVAGLNAVVDVRHDASQKACIGLAALGQVRIADPNFRWIKLAVGRNHGLTIGQLKKVMVAAEAMPMGKFNINNTHTLVGILDHKVDAVLAKLATVRVNGRAVSPEIPTDRGLGNAAYERE